ncbi:MAG TPA: phosphotransferase [Oligoflexia bacterium]|nr:phosphotransferase [Oligoflexia bacterium]HMP27543.1 phosphotransferase [Oligoflexia bacterium]
MSTTADNHIILSLSKMFSDYFGVKVVDSRKLPPSASPRVMYRLIGSNGASAIGVYYDNLLENKAMLNIYKALNKHQIPVAEIYFYDLESGFYLMQDLGEHTLYELWKIRLSQPASEHSAGESQILPELKEAVEVLAKMQTQSVADIDREALFPRKNYDREAVEFDLNYFRDSFVKQALPETDFVKLDQELGIFADQVLSCYGQYFVHRDFNTRNLMLYNQKVYVIDYQTGRLGPLQYDLASLIFHVRVPLSEGDCSKLVAHYLQILSDYRVPVAKNEFVESLPLFGLFRTLQTFGASGKVGLSGGKKQFSEVIKERARLALGLIDQLTRADRKNHLSYLREILSEL